MASKVTFRSRALDVNRQLSVYGAAELTDLSEYAAVNRNVPVMPTGMEKDEEMELHLVEAMHAQTATNTGVTPSTSKGVVIPTPAVTADVAHYDEIYAGGYTPPNLMIKVEASLNVDPELCEYDLDGADETWLSDNAEQGVEPADFEMVMDRLEKASQRQVISLREARALMPSADENVLQIVYDYWVEKRLNVKHALCPHVRSERRDVSVTSTLATQSASSPYIAFRRRAEKMQTRKNRKTDEEGYEKILKFSHDLHRATVLLEMLKKREKTKRELINLHAEVVGRRHALQDWSGVLVGECEREAKPVFSFTAPQPKPSKQTHASRKRSHRSSLSDADADIASKAWLEYNYDEWHRSSVAVSPPRHATSSRRSAINTVLESIDALASTSTSAALDGDFMFKRRRGCVYHAPTPSTSTDGGKENDKIVTPTAASWADTQRDENMQFHRTYLHSRPNVYSAQGTSAQMRYIGKARRRVARGGRIVYDRQIDEDANDYESTLPSTSVDMEHNYFYRPVVRQAAVPSSTIPTSSTVDAPSSSSVTLTSTALPCVDDDTANSLQAVYASLPSSSRCAIPSDSGYNSPAGVRSRSLQRAQHHINMDRPYALVKDGRGDVCAIPITVGVSPALFAQHQQRVAQLWPKASTSTAVAPAPPPENARDVSATTVDRIVAFQACAAVQNSAFVDSLMVNKRGAPPEIDTAPPHVGEYSSSSNSPTSAGSGGDLLARSTHHHPLPTPSPSPNDDQQTHHMTMTNGASTDATAMRLTPVGKAHKQQLIMENSSPPQSEGDVVCHQPLITITAEEQAYMRSNGQTNGQKSVQHHSTNAAVR